MKAVSERDQQIIAGREQGMTFRALGQQYGGLSANRVQQIIRTAERRKSGKPFPWNILGGVGTPADPLDQWSGATGLQRDIIALYRRGMNPVAIAGQLKTTVNGLVWSDRGYIEVHHHIAEVIHSWTFRVVAIAYDRGLLPQAPAEPPEAPSGRGRPLDMGGPRDEWIERSPWDEV